jgi:hypothetical protein
MTKIEIVSRPAGQAPEWVRDAWIGLKLPVVPSKPGPTEGVLGGPGSPENFSGFHVNTRVAMAILEKSNPQAYEWWEDHLQVDDHSELVFGRQFCKELIGAAYFDK